MPKSLNEVTKIMTESSLEETRKLLNQFRVRLFCTRQVDGCDHNTACSIWGDDGQGGTAEGFKEPLPCNCGALINYQRQKYSAELVQCNSGGKA